jgi:plasmid maintenance system antidote protein VapI
MGISSTLAGVISEHMDEDDVSLGAMAARTGIPKTTLHNRLQNSTGLTFGEFERISAVLGADPSLLLIEAEQRSRSTAAA